MLAWFAQVLGGTSHNRKELAWHPAALDNHPTYDLSTMRSFVWAVSAHACSTAARGIIDVLRPSRDLLHERRQFIDDVKSAYRADAATDDLQPPGAQSRGRQRGRWPRHRPISIYVSGRLRSARPVIIGMIVYPAGSSPLEVEYDVDTPSNGADPWITMSVVTSRLVES